ncbi:MAG: TetR/AcrR family transcriptional regulator [Actinobacteria bacterium]|nr:TetR/AcrR family transcriptional regulator [Actinomycetota bacterium]
MPQRTRSRTNARDALITAAIDHLSRLGPAAVQPQEICRELGISKALVNYHFGTREGLIAEAMVAGYEQYVLDLMAAADAAGNDPVDRLIAWIDRQVEWTSEHRGLAAALDFPDVALATPLDPESELFGRLNEAGARNFANLQLLVLDARAHLKRDDPTYEPDATELGLTSAVIGWVTLGLAVWVGGNHLPTQRPSMRAMLPVARVHVRTLLIELLSR